MFPCSTTIIDENSKIGIVQDGKLVLITAEMEKNDPNIAMRVLHWRQKCRRLNEIYRVQQLIAIVLSVSFLIITTLSFIFPYEFWYSLRKAWVMAAFGLFASLNATGIIAYEMAHQIPGFVP